MARTNIAKIAAGFAVETAFAGATMRVEQHIAEHCGIPEFEQYVAGLRDALALMTGHPPWARHLINDCETIDGEPDHRLIIEKTGYSPTAERSKSPQWNNDASNHI